MPLAVKVKCEKVKASDLEPGDLFSTLGSEYWDGAMDAGSIGERVFVRTMVPASAAPDADTTIYRLTIEKIVQ